MQRYLDGYVIPVSKRKLAAYRKLAQAGAAVWMRCGALQYVECVGEDLKSAAKWGCVPFLKLAGARRGETVIFSFIVYRSRAHRDAVNARAVKDPLMSPERMQKTRMPFELKRMAVGGFETMVLRDRPRSRRQSR